MILENNIGLSGHFTLQVRKASDDSLVKEVAFNNLITNTGLDQLATGSGNIIGRCVIGTGSTTPANGDTALAAFSAATTVTPADAPYTVTSQSTVLPYYTRHIRTFRFNAGTLNGNYSELGLTGGPSPFLLFCRALILDNSGNPTTITILSDEYLDVIYELRAYIPYDDVVSTIDITGVGTGISLTRRTINIDKIGNNAGTIFSGGEWWQTTLVGWALNPFQSQIGQINNVSAVTYYATLSGLSTLRGRTDTSTASLGTPLYSSWESVNSSTYVTGTYQKDATLVLGLSQHNGQPIRSLFVNFAGAGCYQFLLGQDITKTSGQTLTFNLRTTWGRYTPPAP